MPIRVSDRYSGNQRRQLRKLVRNQ
jgi:hypothetical protein